MKKTTTIFLITILALSATAMEDSGLDMPSDEEMEQMKKHCMDACDECEKNPSMESEDCETCHMCACAACYLDDDKNACKDLKETQNDLGMATDGCEMYAPEAEDMDMTLSKKTEDSGLDMPSDEEMEQMKKHCMDACDECEKNPSMESEDCETCHMCACAACYLADDKNACKDLKETQNELGMATDGCEMYAPEAEDMDMTLSKKPEGSGPDMPSKEEMEEHCMDACAACDGDEENPDCQMCHMCACGACYLDEDDEACDALEEMQGDRPTDGCEMYAPEDEGPCGMCQKCDDGNCNPEEEFKCIDCLAKACDRADRKCEKDGDEKACRMANDCYEQALVGLGVDAMPCEVCEDCNPEDSGSQACDECMSCWDDECDYQKERCDADPADCMGAAMCNYGEEMMAEESNADNDGKFLAKLHAQ